MPTVCFCNTDSCSRSELFHIFMEVHAEEIGAATGRPESVFLVKRVARCRDPVVSSVTRVQPSVRIPASKAASSAGATPDPCEPEWRPHFRSLHLRSYAATSSAAEDAEKTE
jgi:hypothetical protein